MIAQQTVENIFAEAQWPFAVNQSFKLQRYFMIKFSVFAQACEAHCSASRSRDLLKVFD
jgi:hypothetical protein